MSPIHLLSLGNADPRIIEGLRQPLHDVFDVPVEVMEKRLDIEEFYDDARGQYNSTSILHRLRDENSPSKLLAILNGDLYIPILTYVFGEAELGGNAAVISYHRLQNERYGLPPDPLLLMRRIRKEAVHELGHAFGLRHCLSLECVMHTSTYVGDIDLKGEHFCPDCHAQLMPAIHDAT